jgi:hypothetical protein
MKQIANVLPTQSVWDVCLQHYGSTQGIGQLLLDNLGLFGGEGRFENFEKVRVGGVALVPRVVKYFATLPPAGEEVSLQNSDVVYLTDELGNILTDEFNNQLTE